MLEVSIYLEGGIVITERFKEFSVSKNVYGEITKLKWTHSDPDFELLSISLDKIIAITSHRV